MKSNLNIFLDFYNITQKELADSIGINRNTIGRYCSGNFESINRVHLDLLCSFFKCSLNDLFETENIEVNYPSEMVKNMIQTYKAVQKLSQEEKNNIVTDFSDDNIKASIKPNRISGKQVLKKAKQFEETNGYNPIPTNDEYYEMELMQDKLDMEYDLEYNLEQIINFIISNANITELPLKFKSEIEAYQNIDDMALSFKFILVYRSLYVLIVKQFYYKQLLDFISKLRRLYNTSGLLDLDDNILRDLVNESDYLLNELNTKQKD